MKSLRQLIKLPTAVLVVAGLVALTALVAVGLSSRSALAACTAPATNYGSVTQSINVTSTGTTNYRVWSRIMAPSASANSYLLEVDSGSCFVVGGSSAITPSVWTWVNYQNGSTASSIDVSLAPGAHSLKMIGTSAGFKLDRVLLVTDTSCTPTGTGDNCAVASPPPTVSVAASPTAVLQGQSVALTATAVDKDSTITKVDFFDNSTLIGSDTTSPYTLNWATTASTTPGSHSITAKATDALGLFATSSAVQVTVNAPPPTVTISVPASVSGTAVAVAASPTSSVGIAKVEFRVDNNLVNTDTTSPYGFTWDSTTVANGTHTLTATAYDKTGSQVSASASVNVNNTPPADTQAPTVFLFAPPNGGNVSGNSVTLSASASDNVAVVSVSFSVDGAALGSPDTTSPYGATWDSTKVKNGTHTLMATAIDAAGNSSNSQATVNVNNGDTTPPSNPTALSATAASATQVNLSWTASTDNVAVAGYHIVRDGVTIQTTIGTTTTYADKSVAQSTTYSYYVIAYDAAGNTSVGTSNLASVTTPAATQVDQTAPTWPAAGANLTALAVSGTQINLTWNAAVDNVAIKSYQVFRDNATLPIAIVNTPGYGDTGLTAGSTHSYYVIAIDTSGLPSEISNLASATTPTPPPPLTGNVVGTVTASGAATTSSNPYPCSTHPTLSKTASAPTDTTTLNCVKRVQFYLNTFNNAGLSVDGWFGGNTQTAVKNYQSKFGLTTDPSGTVATQTWNSLESKGTASVTNPYPCSTHPTLSKTASAPTDTTTLNCVKRVQFYLNTFNNAGLSVDGWFGGNTQTAVKNYQSKFGLTTDPSGTVATQTWNSLESKGSSATPASGALISYNVGGLTFTVTADSQGKYSATGVPAGSISLTYSLANYASKTTTVTVTGGQTTTNDVTLNHL